MSSGVSVAPRWEARPRRQTGLPNAAAGRRRKGWPEICWMGDEAALIDSSSRRIALFGSNLEHGPGTKEADVKLHEEIGLA